MKMEIAKIPHKLFIFCAVLGFSSPSTAASIQNLSSSPQTIEVRSESGEFETVTIDSWDNYSKPGMLRVRFKGEEGLGRTIESDEQFAIWSSTSMGPQRKSGALHN